MGRAPSPRRYWFCKSYPGETHVLGESIPVHNPEESAGEKALLPQSFVFPRLRLILRTKHRRQCPTRIRRRRLGRHQPRKHVISVARGKSRSVVDSPSGRWNADLPVRQCRLVEDGTTCEACRELDLSCTRDKPRRKRGPPSRCVVLNSALMMLARAEIVLDTAARNRRRCE